jgi:hypothetical protein
MALAGKLHVDDCELINPGAQVHSKWRYLDSVASGELTYRVWEPDTEIRVRLYGCSAIIRYRSRAEVINRGQQVPAELGTLTPTKYATASGR